MGVTEDDVNEIKQDISSFRFELLDIFRNNGMKCGDAEKGNAGTYLLFCKLLLFRYSVLIGLNYLHSRKEGKTSRTSFEEGLPDWYGRRFDQLRHCQRHVR